jgi:DNA mismatch repair protein MutS
MVGGERFVTDELREYEGQILGAQERSIEIERTIFRQLVSTTEAWIERIAATAARVAETDVLACFARNALDYQYVRPVVDEGELLSIIDGRHPVIERVIAEPFVPNTTELDLTENRIKIVTGPNMAGKSTYLRQTALIVLMAQIGSWVPAASAHIGVVDRIFTRVGASDNLARGQSTFLVEMLETASILNNATSRSLIIMDEIGRGTSTYDGLSLARAVVEYLLEHRNVGGRTLFATHYHEMTVLGDREGAGNLNVQVREWNDEVIFLRKVVPGAADKSYGIHVSRLAGLPHTVIRRARQILHELEDREGTRPVSFAGEGQLAVREVSPQLSLFGAREESVIERIKAVSPDHLTPLDALSLLAELKEQLDD